jgi:hypothetical protein
MREQISCPVAGARPIGPNEEADAIAPEQDRLLEGRVQGHKIQPLKPVSQRDDEFRHRVAAVTLRNRPAVVGSEVEAIRQTANVERATERDVGQH